VRSAVVVLVLPAPQLDGQLGNRSEGRAAVEFFFVGSMTTFDFAVTLRAPRRDVAMGNPEIAQMPREVGPELAAVVGLDALNRDGQSAPDLFDEGDRVWDRTLRIDLENAIATFRAVVICSPIR
jgi:hypothetical protein